MENKPEIGQMVNTPFFFILGRPRSGTTLLRSLLDAHPHVAIPPEHSNMVHLYMKYRNQTASWSGTKTQSFIKDLVQSRIVATQWALDKDIICKYLDRFDGQPLAFDNIIKIINSSYISPHPKRKILAIGDKSPVNSLYTNLLFKAFPGARFVVLVRDYRANLASMLKHDIFPPGVVHLSMQWKKSLADAQKIAAKHAGRFFFVRYEDFVSKPEDHMEALCHFLELPFVKEVLDASYREKAVKQLYDADFVKNWQSVLDGEITVRNIDKWKNELSPAQVKKADFIAGKTGVTFGYMPVYHSFSLIFSLQMAILKIFFYLNEVNRYLYDHLPYRLKPVIRERRFVLSRELVRLFRKKVEKH